MFGMQSPQRQQSNKREERVPKTAVLQRLWRLMLMEKRKQGKQTTKSWKVRLQYGPREETQVIGGDSGVRSQLQSPPAFRHSHTCLKVEVEICSKHRKSESQCFSAFRVQSSAQRLSISRTFSPTTLMAFKRKRLIVKKETEQIQTAQKSEGRKR